MVDGVGGGKQRRNRWERVVGDVLDPRPPSPNTEAKNGERQTLKEKWGERAEGGSEDLNPYNVSSTRYCALWDMGYRAMGYNANFQMKPS